MDFDRIIGQLSEEELDDLSRKIEESRKQRSELVTYEVSFRVKFWPFAHQNERILSVCDFRSDISNELPRLIEDWFNLPDKPEGFSDLRVKKLEPAMGLHKLLVKEDGEGYPLAIGIYSNLSAANRAKELCPGSFLMALPLDYIPGGCPEGMQAYRVNVDGGADYVSTEQIDVFSVEGGFTPAEHYWLHPFEQEAGEMCLELWAKSKMDAEISAWCCYERFKESFPDNSNGFFTPGEWAAMVKNKGVTRLKDV